MMPQREPTVPRRAHRSRSRAAAATAHHNHYSHASLRARSLSPAAPWAEAYTPPTPYDDSPVPNLAVPQGPTLTRSPATRVVRLAPPPEYPSSPQPSTSVSVGLPTAAAADEFVHVTLKASASPQPIPSRTHLAPPVPRVTSTGATRVAKRLASLTPYLPTRVVEAALVAAVPHTPGATAAAVCGELEKIEIHHKFRTLRLRPTLSPVRQVGACHLPTRRRFCEPRP